METVINLNQGWKILQDVHDTGEKLKLYEEKESFTFGGAQISEWEPLEELKHLQLLYAQQPYFGRELRYFNQAPWWYRIEFDVPEKEYESAQLRFTNADYYAKVWLNGEFLGEHEGYSAPFTFETKGIVKPGKRNYLTVKVSAPWDTEVEQDREESRTFLIKRNMVKGTYEHSDTFIQRDVNPVGIYGRVELVLSETGCIGEKPEVTYQLGKDLKTADAAVKVFFKGLKIGQQYKATVKIKEEASGLVKAQETIFFTAENGEIKKQWELSVEDIQLWNTWDHGYPWMYVTEVFLEKEGSLLSSKSIGLAFRKTEIERSADITRFWINDKKFYVRGTSYFPDCYISAMTEERYLRDLLNIKAAGFNLVRVHVHTEQEVFYDLCDKLGIAVLQDSEYNWTHPATDEWAGKFADIYRENVRLLKHHPSLLCWIIMNEPGCVDPDGKIRTRFMEENPGPRLYREVEEMDPGRPIIKGSFCEEDLFSGDSHNYLGSLSGGEYREIYGQSEKLNTEYGFDAPPCSENLKKVPVIYRRLQSLTDKIPEIQEYQYKLLKYYTEHYRIQKYDRCSGYVQFMFIDLCPQSFYGLYDWWGVPKKGLSAMMESNAPIGVFVKHKDSMDGIYAVNDTEKGYQGCLVRWIITDGETGELVEENSRVIDLEEDSCKKVFAFPKEYGYGKKWNVFLVMKDAKGNYLAQNRYTDICTLLSRVKGHPDRMSHETGMRLYWA